MHAKKSASNRAPQNRGVRRVAEPDDEIPKINPSEVETLIKKIEQTTLSEQDKRMITRLLRTLLYVVGLLQEKKVTLLRLKELVFGKKSEAGARGRRMSIWRELKARSQKESRATGGVHHQSIPGREKSIAVISN